MGSGVGSNPIPKAEYPLTPAQSAVADRFAHELYTNFDHYKSVYQEANGKVINADAAKELSPDFRADRTENALAVHEPASWFAKQLFNEALASSPTPGHANDIVFTAGGAGSGKTTAVNGDSESRAIFDNAHAVFDGTMRPADKAEMYVRQTLDAGKNAAVIYVHRDPVEAFNSGVLDRAMHGEAKLEGGGRTLPLEEFAKQHSSIQDSMRHLQEKFGNDPRFEMRVINNSGERGKAEVSALDKLPPNPGYKELVGKLTGELEKARGSGRISEKVYRATKGSLGSGTGESGSGTGAEIGI